MPELIDLQPDNLGHSNWKQAGHADLPVLTVEQVRLLENTAFSHTDSFLLMQAAGIRTANKISEQLLHRETQNWHCLVLAGPGNNGGDACIVAGELKRKGFQVELLQLTDGKTGSKDRMQAVIWALAHGVQPVELDADARLPSISPGTVVVDGLLGIACDRAPEGLFHSLITHVNLEVERLQQPGNKPPVLVYSLDCPSGLDCNTGLAPGAAIQAHTTFTYLACKTGLLGNQGKSLAGELWLEELNCQPVLEQLLEEAALHPVIQAVSRTAQLRRLPVRRHEHHKGSFGSLAIIGGEKGMIGACLLSARTALMLGCGRVALSLLFERDMHLPDVQQQNQVPFLDVVFPEIMNKGLEANLEFADVVIVGPGLGQSTEAVQTLMELLEHDKGLHMVWDADALNLLAANSALRNRLQAYRKRHPGKALVFTPHPLEAARLLQSNTDIVQANRSASVQVLARQFDCTVVLKGAGSLICSGEKVEINLTGGPALGTAGSGDVLAGAIGGMLGQGLNGFDAAAFATYLHGLAVEAASNGNRQEQDELMISHASEIALRMKNRLNHLLNQDARRNG